ncbi:Anaerobic ribonucleoside-triphosphate reductase [Acidipropionibacterium acidipropionici ATCC 4875]|uniref:Anaerobic ribonucleoside-triphosphate reductase n=2 Tax=Acidipropionibacterium acidipropionici TaxID=1748 RepID=K7S046_ACIA4|nr:Anaerobic ribonucleoside-triphosphate reductase [Acidipropionibacterium acidipropionici ATCC 4875]ALN14713.1 anaerobic ribonucleoside triphosphate reductase [Acidipropionibacterium acidipropionici]APZ09533.1 anaerobic ribonucleoside triphosphate reductase [Acidipropionibacterium acidipropionici]
MRITEDSIRAGQNTTHAPSPAPDPMQATTGPAVAPRTVSIPTAVRKRDGRTVPFDTGRITRAVARAFTATQTPDPQPLALQVTLGVLNGLVAAHTAEPGVEEIQDTVEKVLMAQGHGETAKAYILYRQHRTFRREEQSSLMTALRDITFASAEDCDAKRENANIDAHSAMGSMLRFGSESAKQFNMLQVLDPAHAAAHRDGDIHIHDLDFLTLTTTCCQIDLTRLFERGFSTGHGVLRPPQSIGSYAALACIAIQSNQNDQHGGQAVPDFDRDMAPGVAKTLRSRARSGLVQAWLLMGGDDADAGRAAEVASDWVLDPGPDALRAERDGVRTLFATLGIDAAEADRIAARVRRQAVAETERLTYQAMEAFIANLNTMNSRAGAQTPFSSINYGTDTSAEARLVVRCLLECTQAGLGGGETAIFPIQIFRVAEGVNYNPGDPNYDLFQLACRTSAKRLFPNFSFQDAPFNAQYHRPGHPETEVAYMGCRTRVMANVHDPSREITYGRGNLSFTSINLPRLAILADHDVDRFFTSLDEMMDLVIEQLLDRLKIQSQKRVRNFPFLMGQGVWVDSEGLRPDDPVAEVLKHGTLSVGFIGLAEALVALVGTHHGESEEAEKLGLRIIGRMRERTDRACEETGLNFSTFATPAEGLSGRFLRIDRERFGVLPGITDRDYYTNGFHVPVYFPITASDKIDREAPFHALTNGGHISYVEMDGDPSRNVEAFEAIVRHMHDAGVGYGSINHPVDRDPVCGYNGIIDDVCPGCGRHEGSDGVGFERIRRITGYLVGTLDRFNDAKRAEEADRVKHA